MAQRIVKSVMAAAAVSGALVAGVVTASGAQAATWTYETTYLHYGQCLYYGQQGVAAGSWAAYDCRVINGQWGTNGPGDVQLWVRG